MANTVNAALKPLETLSRIVNQPSSLFGGKGGSSKSKAEHDTAGAARDSTSSAQDPGDPGEAEPVEGAGPAQGPDSDLMDGEAEGDSVVIAGRPEVLGTQEMQVLKRVQTHTHAHVRTRIHTHPSDLLTER